ncbi:MAG: hypothetical protein IPK15_24205 [Verrucomicrobia bacterium]|nr:hypothetical protein [Verrucomicrobiota bacterium]
MSYAELKQAAQELNPAELDELLRSLSRDERFFAVVGWLERNREAFINAGSRQEIAGDYGKLAHAQGSVHAVNVLVAQMANVVQVPSLSLESNRAD